jgi:hypothetical protein
MIPWSFFLEELLLTILQTSERVMANQRLKVRLGSKEPVMDFQTNRRRRRMTRKKMLCMILSLSLCISFLLSQNSRAGLFGDYVPEGKEIKDPYLEQLFAPEYPYEWLRVIDTTEGKRYVVMKGKRKLTKEMEEEYQQKTLRKRNITIYRYRSPRDNELISTNIRLSRKVSDKPYVIEYCQASPWASRDKEKDIAWRAGKYFVLWIDKDFGKTFKKLTIYPDKEVSCPNPPFVGKYPNSIALGCTKQTFIEPGQPYYKKGQSRIKFTYVSKDVPEKIYDFYKDKLIDHFKKIGFNFPENFWKYNHEFGIQIPYYGIDIVDKILSSLEDRYILHGGLQSSPFEGQLPDGGAVFNIKIYKGVFAENLINEYSWIQVLYDIEQNAIERKMKESRK